MNLREFARAIGVSVSTVSRALNGYTDVNEDTRRRIIKSAQELGYTAEPAARRLRKRSSGLIAFVLSYPQKHFANPFFLDMIAGIDERLRGTDFHLVIASASSFEDEIETFKRLVEQQRVDGLLFARTRRLDERITYLQKRGVPFVTHGRSENPVPFPFLDVDQQVVGRDGCARFISLGHRRIALLNTPSYLMYSHHRRQGYEAALEAAGLSLDPDLVIEEDLTEEGGAAGARRLLDLREPPSAILCGHDFAAIGAIRAVYECGKIPGTDIAIIGCDDNPFGRYTSPPLTTFTAPREKIGRRLAEMLLASIGGTVATELQEVWKPQLEVRGSDGPSRLLYPKGARRSRKGLVAQ